MKRNIKIEYEFIQVQYIRMYVCAIPLQMYMQTVQYMQNTLLYAY